MTIQSFVEKKTDKSNEEKETSQLDELTRTLQRVQADFDNYRKRTQAEQHAFYLRGNAAALKDMLAFVDTLDAAAANGGNTESKKGMEQLRTQFHAILTQHGVKPIPVLGKPFDPFTSECLQQGNDANKGDDEVIEEFQKGYYFHADVLRTAKVKVNKKDSQENEKNEMTNNGGN